MWTCGCVNGESTNERTKLWREVSVADDDRFDFDTACVLTSNSCPRHGKSFCKSIVRYDDKKERRSAG